MTGPGDARRWDLSQIPGSVVYRAVQDSEFVVRLLHQDTRREALSDPSLGLTDEQQTELFARLDEIARMSFTDAIQVLQDDVGVVFS